MTLDIQRSKELKECITLYNNSTKEIDILLFNKEFGYWSVVTLHTVNNSRNKITDHD